MMRKFVMGTVAVAAIAGLAGTADAQGLFAGPPVNWSGPYVGGEGGYGWGQSSHSDATGFNSGPFDADGGTFGGTAGYNWQLNGPLVVGLEGDMGWADMGGTTTNTCSGTCSTHLTDLGTARGRVGWSFGTIMPYATAGLVFGDLHGGEGGGAGASGAGNTYRVGWTAGAGVEDAFAPHWSAKLEYLHVDLGNGPVFDDTLAGGGSAAEHVNFNSDMVRAGINYHFW
jgi:outer membrane immunogenic protein